MSFDMSQVSTIQQLSWRKTPSTKLLLTDLRLQSQKLPQALVIGACMSTTPPLPSILFCSSGRPGLWSSESRKTPKWFPCRSTRCKARHLQAQVGCKSPIIQPTPHNLYDCSLQPDSFRVNGVTTRWRSVPPPKSDPKLSPYPHLLTTDHRTAITQIGHQEPLQFLRRSPGSVWHEGFSTLGRFHQKR